MSEALSLSIDAIARQLTAEEIQSLRKIIADSQADPFGRFLHNDYLSKASLIKFMRLRLVDPKVGSVSRSGLSPVAFEVLHFIDNPPPRDRFNELSVWFRSKPWSVPVVLCFVGLGAIGGMLAGLKAILDWFGIGN